MANEKREKDIRTGELEKHPCFSEKAHHKYSRMHLPVAPKCNIKCNYCNRKYDCTNESRPGVTSQVLSPEEALEKFLEVDRKIESLSVVGIAGPGDALANWAETKKTIELIKEKNKEVLFCISTNGLLLSKYAAEIIELGINHVTVTVNCIKPGIGSKIYNHITYNGRSYQGIRGASLLIEKQLAGIKRLTEKGVLVKVNTVMIKNINDNHIEDIVKKVKELGAFITNIMPLIPAKGSNFENHAQTSRKDIDKIREVCDKDMLQMRHCKQCRADAIGLLGEDISYQFNKNKECLKVNENISKRIASEEATKKIAVASKSGIIIDQHFGHVKEFLIYEGNEKGFKLKEKREVKKYCSSEDCQQENRKEKVIKSLSDCNAVLVLRIGYSAQKKLKTKNIASFEYCDTIENGLEYVLGKLMEIKGIA